MPVTSQIMFLSTGSVEIFKIIYTVPTDSDNWEKRTTRNLKGTRCLWKSFSQNQYINMCQNVRDHPENRANQDQEGNGIGGAITE